MINICKMVVLMSVITCILLDACNEPISNEINKTYIVKKKEFVSSITTDATIYPFETVAIRPNYSGYIYKILKFPGELVCMGDVILVIKENGNLHDVLATSNGTILNINIDANDYYNSNDSKMSGLVLIGNTRAKKFIAYVDAIDIEKIQNSLICKININDSVYLQGNIQLVNKIGEPTNTGVKYKITGQIQDVNNNIKYFGQSYPLVIEVEKSNSILVIPIAYVYYDNLKPYIYIKDGGSIKRKDIVLGKANDQFLEVTSGIKELDVVVIK